jgi:outer membrane protein assembly factor BamB
LAFDGLNLPRKGARVKTILKCAASDTTDGLFIDLTANLNSCLMDRFKTQSGVQESEKSKMHMINHLFGPALPTRTLLSKMQATRPNGSPLKLVSKRFAYGLTKLVCGAALILPATTSPADNWPQFRGPNRDDISKETGLLKQWPKEGPALAWKLNGLGGGFSGVSVVGNQLFTMGDLEGKEFVIALNLTDRKQQWSTEVGAAFENANGAGPRCTPTVDGDRLFVLTPQGELVCLQSADGKAVWRKNLYKDFGGKMMSGWGYSESPLVDGPNVICTPGGTQGSVVALNKKTGELTWRCEAIKDAATYASLVPIEFGGKRQYIQLGDRDVYGVAADSGKLLWSAPRKGSVAVVPTPIFKDGIVFVTSGYGNGCNAFKLTVEGEAFNAEQIYANKDMANHHGGVVLVGDYVYGHSDSGNRLKCLELKTGKVVWEDKSVAKGSVTYADGMLYVRAEGGAGMVALVEATPESYKETGRFEQPDRSNRSSWPHPVVADGKLYLRDQDLLLCYEVKKSPSS